MFWPPFVGRTNVEDAGAACEVETKETIAAGRKKG
jgi:hypothetical protein